jgi:hypothetical protein
MSERFAISQKAFLRGGPHLTRRRVLAGSGGFVTATLFGSNICAAVPAANELTLNASVARWSLVGGSGPPTDVWCYGNRIPGPELRAADGTF